MKIAFRTCEVLACCARAAVRSKTLNPPGSHVPARAQWRWWRVVCVLALAGLVLWRAPLASAQADEEESDSAEEQTEDTPTQESADVPELSLAAAGGATLRVVEFASAKGPVRLDSGWVPALGVELRALFPSDAFVFGFEARYATSLNAEGVQKSPSPESQPQITAVRSHRFALGARAGMRLGDHGRGVLVGGLLGWAFHALASVGELQVPRFTLHGPLLRLELEIPILPEILLLRIAPQGELIISVTRELRELAETESHGYAFGGELSISVRLWQWLTAELQYHESHAKVQSTLASELSDVERFVLLAARLNL